MAGLGAAVVPRIRAVLLDQPPGARGLRPAQQTEPYRLNGATLSGLTQNVCSTGTVLPHLELGQIGVNMLVLAVIGGLVGAVIGALNRRNQERVTQRLGRG